MKRLALFLITLVMAVGFASGQNLVPNYSLESTSPCPSSGGQINYATDWTSYLNSPDYFHSCGSGNYTTPGPNLGGTQVPADGNAYCAMVCRHSSAYYREHMGAFLTSPLVPGTSYDCTMKISLTDISQHAANRLGFLFRTTPSSTVGNFAHVYTNAVVTDKNGWTTVTGSFTPTTAFTYVVIGNFYDDANTTITNVAGGWYAGAYYYVDSISVTPSVVLPADQVHLDLLEVRDGRVLLGWEANEGHDITSFIVERSLDGGETFDERVQMEPTDDQLHYRFPDAPGRFHIPVLYRVRSFDPNGNSHLSNTVEATIQPGGNMSPDLFPNPVARGESITLRFQPLSDRDHLVRITDLPGRLIREFSVPSDQALQGVEINTHDLSVGTYLIQLRDGSTSETSKFSVTQ